METKASNAPIEAIFAQCGPWQSRFNIDGVVLGGPYDFVADPRIARLQEEISVEGKRVLELGCLEGGHSVALSRRKPRELVAVEGRPANYVRCCVVKNLFGLDNVRFRLDDVRKVSIERYGRFDLVVAMPRPRAAELAAPPGEVSTAVRARVLAARTRLAGEPSRRTPAARASSAR